MVVGFVVVVVDFVVVVVVVGFVVVVVGIVVVVVGLVVVVVVIVVVVVGLVVVVERVVVVIGPDDAEILLESNVTAVCANARPVNVAPVFIAINVLSRIIPLKTEPVLRVVVPATCQKIFFACAPPVRITFLPELISRVPGIWNIHTAFEFPDKVTSDVIITPVENL